MAASSNANQAAKKRRQESDCCFRDLASARQRHVRRRRIARMILENIAMELALI
jgi:hypothetical protein